MRGVYTPVTKIRRKVFSEVARFAYEEKDFSEIDKIPYRIIPGEIARYRDSVFKERAIVGERIRLAMGLPVRSADRHAPLREGIEECATPETYYTPPLVNVIPFACEACPETAFYVTDNCRGCLAHPCTAVCPVQAVSIIDGKSAIDKDKCVRCGRCREACPYNAIVHFSRPCAKACGVDAIESDEMGRAKINYDKCVSCGMCLVNCPFAAIADKSQIYQLIRSMKEGAHVIAEIAPAFVGQLGPLAEPENIKPLLKELGFYDVYEVAAGADIGAVEEAKHFLENVPDKQPFLATSCCPSWASMAKKLFPDIAHCVSEGRTPMVVTAHLIKEKHPDAKVVFIGPCAAKKLEAMRKSVRSEVDFVITFEELMGMMAAKGITLGEDTEKEPFTDATAAGRGYPVSGGVAEAIIGAAKTINPGITIPTERADSLSECRKMLTLARAGKRNGYLLEGMACPGGCIGGAGTVLPTQKAATAIKKYKEQSEKKNATENPLLRQKDCADS
ncbi:MAG: 4Fe-4S dicluster domain-containing protein [Clostridia bacterium]|nr:4Fe-4S dicluster domain-containing protein [Clostridia bacterium]